MNFKIKLFIYSILIPFSCLSLSANTDYPNEIKMGLIDGYYLNLISPLETSDGDVYYFLDADNNGYPFSGWVSGILVDDSVHYDWLDALINEGQDITENTNSIQKDNFILSLPSKDSLASMAPQVSNEKSSEYPGGQYWSSTLYQPGYHYRVGLMDGGSFDYASDSLSSTATGNVIFKVKIVSDSGEDIVKPELSVPAPISINVDMPGDVVAANSTPIIAFLAGAVATDNVDGNLSSSISNDAPSEFEVGETIVNFSVSDTAGNSSTDYSSVTVVILDTDNDGIPDYIDNCVNWSNANQINTDSDLLGDACDVDDDGDGILDVDDDLPLDSSESVDTDGDGIGNNSDPDDDNDGVLDSQDAFPLKNTETKDSDGDGIGDNDEERADLVASDVLSQRMIHYLGFLASVFMEDSEDVAGQSGTWSLAIGSSVNNSFACINGGGYNTVTTRTDFTSLRVNLTFLNCNYDGLIVNNSATFTWEDSYFEQLSPRQFFPMEFSFNNLSITDSSNAIFRYFGSLSCDVAYNSVTESWTEKTEGDTIIYERQWGSLYDSSVPWDNNSLVSNDAGNTDIYVANGVNNCDFDSVSVTNNGQTHTILNAKYLAQPYGRGYNISENTRQERLQKAITKEVFARQIFTEETGWVREKWSKFKHDPVVRLTGNREFGLNVYSDVVLTYFFFFFFNYGDIIYQEIDQFSDLEWVFLDITSGKITANNFRYEPNTNLDHENDGQRDNINAPWVISRFMSPSDSTCNWILRYQDWIVVEQGIDKQVYCEFLDGFYIYNNKVEYQDINLDGKNELFTWDDDNDNVLDALDNCQSIPNSDQLDTDNDSLGNVCDADDDGDSVPDTLDAFPLDSSESIDTDGDGVGNNSDWAPYNAEEFADSDGDGVGDNSDAFPNDSAETLDMDGDGIGDNSDSDIDGDGALNSNDPYPLNGEYSADTDNDGMPDEWETRYGLDPNDPSDATSDQDNDGVSALDEFLAGTIPSGSLDLDGNENYDALTDGLLLLRGMFGLDGSALVTGTIASDATYTESVDIELRIATLGDLADIDGNGTIDALTDGLLTLRYLFGLEGDTLINGVVAEDATRKTAEEIEAHLETLMPAL